MHWSVRKSEWSLFGLIFAICFLINVDYHILRSIKAAVVVTERGAEAIPYLQVLGVVPGVFALNWILARLMRRYSSAWIFSVSAVAFLAFFGFFAIWPAGSLAGSYYVIAELWRVGLLGVLFWGFINRHLEVGEAKRFYGPLMLGSSLGATCAGYLTMGLEGDLGRLTGILFLVGILSIFLFVRLCRLIGHRQVKSKERYSLSESFSVVWRSPYLKTLGWIVFADYVAYTLGEVVFLHVLKEYLPSQAAYCAWMGRLTFWGGLLTVVTALFVAPLVLQRCKWVVAALVTPIVLLATKPAFYLAVCWPSLFGVNALQIAVVLGSLHSVFCRATKYTFFDASKELAYVPLDQDAQVKGKLVIDGIGARLGRGFSSWMTIALLRICGSIGAMAPFVGTIAIGFGFVWLKKTLRLGKAIEQDVAPVGQEEAAQARG